MSDVAAARLQVGYRPNLSAVVAELAEVVDLAAVTYEFPPGRQIVSEGRHCGSVFLLTEGIAMRYRVLLDGQRQILNFLVPGDFAGMISSQYKNALYSVKTLTHTWISLITTASLLALFETRPRLAGMLFGVLSDQTALLTARC